MMLNMLNEKVDYSKDPEAPISLGMKLLKKLEKEGWKGADVYDAIEEIIISSDVKYPKQMAMRLKRTLENYDMWEAPYKGLVNKIQKWQFVNENLAAFVGKAAGRAIIGHTARQLGKQMRNFKKNESADDLDDENSYYDRLNDPNGERVKYEIEIAPHCSNVVYKRLFSGDFVRNVKLEYEHPFEDYGADVIEISAPSGQYRNLEDVLNRMLKNGVINDFDLVGSYEASDLNESVEDDKSSKLNERHDNWDADDDYYYEPDNVNNKEINYHSLAFDAIRYLNVIIGEWTIYDIKSQLNSGKIDYDTIIDVMGRKMNADISDYEYEIIAQAINDEMARYYNDNKYMINESAEDDNEIKYYYRPIDIKILMRQQKERQLSKYEYYVLEAAMWARARSNNYHGYAPELPAVKYENGKFYASTKHDGMTEVPFNYKVMTKEWLFKN